MTQLEFDLVIRKRAPAELRCGSCGVLIGRGEWVVWDEALASYVHTACRKGGR